MMGVVAAPRRKAFEGAVQIGDGTGLELIQRLEAAGRPEKAIVITAYGSAENAVEALKAGKVRVIGASNFTADRLSAALQASAKDKIALWNTAQFKQRNHFSLVAARVARYAESAWSSGCEVFKGT